MVKIHTQRKSLITFKDMMIASIVDAYPMTTNNDKWGITPWCCVQLLHRKATVSPKQSSYHLSKIRNVVEFQVITTRISF